MSKTILSRQAKARPPLQSPGKQPEQAKTRAGDSKPERERTMPIDGRSLLNQLVDAVRRYVVLPRGAAEGAALWIVFTYTIDAFDIAPILAILSPIKGCGKTTLLMILRALVARPQVASNITPAALFRVIDKLHPTLLVDEIDTQLSYRSDELRGILNAGHTRTTAKVIRAVGDGKDYNPREFDTPCANNR
jgi:putative DNA primase/helicase